MINSSRFSRTFVRKFWTAAGNLGGVAGLLMICFADCDRTLAVTGLCVAMGISGINAAGYLVRRLKACLCVKRTEALKSTDGLSGLNTRKLGGLRTFLCGIKVSRIEKVHRSYQLRKSASI